MIAPKENRNPQVLEIPLGLELVQLLGKQSDAKLGQQLEKMFGSVLVYGSVFGSGPVLERASGPAR